MCFVFTGRTFPTHPYYSAQLGAGQLSLYNILKAYSLLDQEVGYCQGLSFVAGILLLHMGEEEAFNMSCLTWDCGNSIEQTWLFYRSRCTSSQGCSMITTRTYPTTWRGTRSAPASMPRPSSSVCLPCSSPRASSPESLMWSFFRDQRSYLKWL